MRNAKYAAVDEDPAVLFVKGKVRLKTIQVHCGDSAARYLQLFDVGAIGDITVGTTAPDLVHHCASSTVNVAPTASYDVIFENGIVAAATTTPTGSGAPTADMDVSITWEFTSDRRD